MDQRSKLPRLFRFLQLVSSQRRMKAEEIAQKLGVTKRTVYRYRQDLEDAGFAIYSDGKGYQLASAPFLPSLDLEREEAIALLLVADSHWARGMTPYGQTLSSAMEKIKSGMQPDIQEGLHETTKDIAVRQEPQVDMSGHEETFQTLLRAIQNRQVIGLSYCGVSDPKPWQRNVEPLSIFQCWLAWYLIAHCRYRNSLRTFRLDRIHSVRTISETFVPPRNFDLQDYLRNAWLVEQGDDVFEVIIRFWGKAARLAEELKWHPTQETLSVREGHCIMRFKTGGLREVSEWLMRYDDEAEVIKPECLRTMMRERALKILEVYEADDHFE